MTHFYKRPGENGGFSFCTAADDAQVPADAIPFDGEDAYLAAIDAIRNPPPTLDQAMASRESALDAACAAAITGGCQSSALGAPHWYGTAQSDQDNLASDWMAAATGGATFTADIPCSTDRAAATWPALPHSGAQIAAVFADFRAWRIACQVRNRALQAQVAAAATVEEVDAIAWG